MKPTRRNFIKTVAVGILGDSIISGLSLPSLARTEKYDGGIEIQKGFKALDIETQKGMEALAETLVPGSKELGIRQIFMEYIAKKPGEAGFFDAGFWNLDAISHNKFEKPFYALESKEEKDAVINHIRLRNRVFFKRFRDTVINFYYSHPEVWKRLSYNGPPQPRGFMDYTSPPKVAGG